MRIKPENAIGISSAGISVCWEGYEIKHPRERVTLMISRSQVD